MLKRQLSDRSKGKVEQKKQKIVSPKKLPKSSSSYIIFDSNALKKAKKDIDLMKCVHGAGTIYRMSAQKRMTNHSYKKFKDARFKMAIVRTWHSTDELPEYAFNVGMAGFVDEFSIHELCDQFNEDFRTKAGVGTSASFLNNYATSLITGKRVAKVRNLILEVLKAGGCVDEQLHCPHCENQLSSPVHLRRHIKENCNVIHTPDSEPNFQCAMCNRTFAARKDLDIHIDQKRCPFLKPKKPNQKFECQFCTAGFTRSNDRNIHEASSCSVLLFKGHSKRTNVHV